MTVFLFFRYASLRRIPCDAVNDLEPSLPKIYLNGQSSRWSSQNSGAWAWCGDIKLSAKDAPKPHCEGGCNHRCLNFLENIDKDTIIAVHSAAWNPEQNCVSTSECSTLDQPVALRMQLQLYWPTHLGQRACQIPRKRERKGENENRCVKRSLNQVIKSSEPMNNVYQTGNYRRHMTAILQSV